MGSYLKKKCRKLFKKICETKMEGETYQKKFQQSNNFFGEILQKQILIRKRYKEKSKN